MKVTCARVAGLDGGQGNAPGVQSQETRVRILVGALSEGESVKAFLDERDEGDIRDLLVGNRVVRVDGDTATLSDGTVIIFVGNNGGCSCGAGDYDLTELNTVDNVITDVKLENLPSGDDYPENPEPGTYRIFVFAGNQKINLATFEGTDGNGYYGTGYIIFAIVEE